MMKMKIPSATVNPDKNVLNLFLLIVSKISLQRSLLNIFRGYYLFYFFIFDYYPVFKLHNTLTHLCNVWFMRNYQDSFPLLIDFLNQIHNFIRSFCVQGTSRLICQ